MPEDFGKHIEELGKTAAENYIPGIKAPDWSLIEQRLNIEMPVKEEKRRRLIFFWFILAGIIITAGLFLALNKNEDKKQITNRAITQSNSQTQEITKPNQLASNPENKLATNTLTSANEPKQSKKTNTAKATTYKQSKNEPNLNNEKNKLLEKNQSLATKAANENPSIEKSNLIKSTPLQKLTENEANTFLTNPVEEEKSAIIGPVLNHATKENDTTVTSLKNTTKQKTNKEKSFELGLTYGLDMSTVKLKHNSPPSHSIGITLSYNFSPKISVRSGLIYTQKNYKANGDDYTYKSWYTPPPTVYSTKLLQAEGYCNMYEIPLSIRYTFNPEAKIVLFASAGASTYLMRKESYDYLIQYNTWAPQQKSRTINEPSNYIFGIADFSVGIRTKVSKKMFFEIQPFAKIPLRGVGNGNILLSSFGTYGNLIYKLPFRKNKN
jgi:hypothetical protein